MGDSQITACDAPLNRPELAVVAQGQAIDLVGDRTANRRQFDPALACHLAQAIHRDLAAPLRDLPAASRASGHPLETGVVETTVQVHLQPTSDQGATLNLPGDIQGAGVHPPEPGDFKPLHPSCAQAALHLRSAPGSRNREVAFGGVPG